MQLIPAPQLSLADLASAYNETRIDYIVPMPMTVERLKRYVEIYDVDLHSSCAAVSSNVILGLGMLGIRYQRGWITRLGVLPAGRRQGTGRAIMEYLLEQARQRHMPIMWLEVIKGNTPAHQLFISLGFEETRELIVARRPPAYRALGPGEQVFRPQVRNIRTYNRQGALALLEQRQDRPNWLNEVESMRKVGDLSAIAVDTSDGGRGWVSFQPSLLQLTHIVVEVTAGDPAGVTAALLQTLHQYYPTQDAICENLPENDPKWPGFEQAGYFDAFHRIEMVMPLV